MRTGGFGEVVNTLDCGSNMRGFDSHNPSQFFLLSRLLLNQDDSRFLVAVRSFSHCPVKSYAFAASAMSWAVDILAGARMSVKTF